VRTETGGAREEVVAKWRRLRRSLQMAPQRTQLMEKAIIGSWSGEKTPKESTPQAFRISARATLEQSWRMGRETSICFEGLRKESRAKQPNNRLGSGTCGTGSVS
jgi:hypothetical protein